MKRLLFTITLLSLLTSAMAQEGYWSHQRDNDDRSAFARNQTRVQLALILDSSGSMDDLIDQARGQMWSMVHEILYNSQSDYGQVPLLEIALFEYGSSNLNRNNDYIQMRVPFTTDLDWIAEELFAIRTGGRIEYHPLAVQQAIRQLQWSRSPQDLRLIFIAGNESFNQGPVNFRRVMAEANSQDIRVNTIFCGDWNRGQQLGWEEAAYLGDGDYLAIESYRRDNFHDPRFQSQLMSLNQAYNATYLPYGAYGARGYQRLCRVDDYAFGYGQTVIINRTLVKVSPVYIYPDWDLVDAYRLGRVDLERLSRSDLPPVMRNMTLVEQRAYLIRQQQARESIRQQITTVAAPRRPMSPPAGSTSPGRQGNAPGARPEPRSASQPQNIDRAISESVRNHQSRSATPGGQRAPQQQIAPRQSVTTQPRQAEQPRQQTTAPRQSVTTQPRQAEPSSEATTAPRSPDRETAQPRTPTTRTPR